jgi:hypothetical protein
VPPTYLITTPQKVTAESDNAKHLLQFYKDLRTQVEGWFSVWKKATELLGLEIPPDIRRVDEKIASANKIINQSVTLCTHFFD